jgi:hypothetical protein
MRLCQTRLLIVLLFISIGTGVFAQQSVLSSGNWYKVSVEEDGVYKITYSLLQKMGIDPSKIDPRKLRVYGNPGGMLPQPNNTARISDLVENAIHVQGEADGKFDKSDYILFFGSGPDKIEYNVNRNIHLYENNLYTDQNFYFLTVGEDNGKRITESPNLGAGYPPVTRFKDFIFHEVDNHNELSSGRDWFGEKFALGVTQYAFDFPVSGIPNDAAIRFVSCVLGQTHTTGKFKVFVNDVNIAEQPVAPISNTNRYGEKGIHRRDTISILGSTVNAEAKNAIRVQYQYEKGTGFSQGYLDYFLMSFDRDLALYNTQTIFVSPSSLNNPISQFQISSVNDPITVWDITDISNIKSQSFDHSNSTASFSTSTTQLKRFIAFKGTEQPKLVGKVSNQNIRGLSVPNLVIVTHPDFVSEAQRLAEHRASFSGWSVHVVTTEQVYNEFSSGRQDVTAIRDFVKSFYNKSSSTLKSLLLFGKCSYDYKDRIDNNTNFVITYESRNSMMPLETYSSDDYFGFLEDTEGLWAERPQPQNHTLDIGVGRLPVKLIAQAKTVVDKIIHYDTNRDMLGYWRKQLAFVADDGNSEDGFSDIHQEQSNDLTKFIESIDPSFDSKKLFMGSYIKRLRGSSETIPEMTSDIIRSFDKGSLIINFTGHGGEDQWTDENVFNSSIITDLDNYRYPFLVTATCEFGRHDDPGDISGAEESVVRENGGSIGLVTTARPVNSTTNFNLNMAFYDALLEKVNNTYRTIGEVFRHTKNNSISGVANRNFSLLGDPSLTLALPSNVVQINQLQTANGSDTVKALSKVIATGEVKSSSNEKLADFNGIVEATLFDKETKLITIGRNDPPFAYTEWKNALFRGRATVKDGEFKIEFMVPKNIAYQVAQGKFSLYAFDPVTNRDANGYYSDFKIGESEGIISDTYGPDIKMYLGDTSFEPGGTVAPDTRLIARLEDETGINISTYGLGNGLIAVLDGGIEQYALNDYFVSDTDNYTDGWIDFPIQDLEPGHHTLTLTAWDVNNNSSQSSLDFIVTGEEIRVETFGTYPNPFVDKSTLFFTHNRSGDELQAQVFIQKPTGEVVGTAEINVPQSGHRVDLMEINTGAMGDKKLAPGLYLARLIVRSLTNGSKNEQVTKLIILN